MSLFRSLMVALLIGVLLGVLSGCKKTGVNGNTTTNEIKTPSTIPGTPPPPITDGSSSTSSDSSKNAPVQGTEASTLKERLPDAQYPDDEGVKRQRERYQKGDSIPGDE
jgi:hypothetical protein